PFITFNSICVGRLRMISKDVTEGKSTPTSISFSLTDLTMEDALLIISKILTSNLSNIRIQLLVKRIPFS
ncbi:hypothetical protein KAI60_01765, partial [Candidatus Bathyarchaeota archaeon]|nr:hypothetical protein [Candidatus Bathyarchaeota archaeon]